jgi:hypothetical protein
MSIHGNWGIRFTFEDEVLVDDQHRYRTKECSSTRAHRCPPEKNPGLLPQRPITEVARHLRVNRPRLSPVLNGKAAISAKLALRISENKIAQQSRPIGRSQAAWTVFIKPRLFTAHPATWLA